MQNKRFHLFNIYQMSITEVYNYIFSKWIYIWILLHIIFSTIFIAHHFSSPALGFIDFVLDYFTLYIMISTILIFNFNTLSFAGEIERRTLETKVTLPYSRSEIFFGKMISLYYLILISSIILLINIIVISFYFGDVPSKYYYAIIKLIVLYNIFTVAMISVSAVISISIKEILPSIMMMACYFIGMIYITATAGNGDTIGNMNYSPNYTLAFIFPLYGIANVNDSLLIEGSIDMTIYLILSIYCAILMFTSLILFKELEL